MDFLAAIKLMEKKLMCGINSLMRYWKCQSSNLIDLFMFQFKCSRMRQCAVNYKSKLSLWLIITICVQDFFISTSLTISSFLIESGVQITYNNIVDFDPFQIRMTPFLNIEYFESLMATSRWERIYSMFIQYCIRSASNLF